MTVKNCHGDILSFKRKKQKIEKCFYYDFTSIKYMTVCWESIETANQRCVTAKS